MTSMRITLAIGSIADRWKSSELYQERLASALAKQNCEFDFQNWRSEIHGNAMIRRRILVPRELHSEVEGPLHLLDQSYGDSLLSYSGPKIATVADINFWHERGWNPLRIALRHRITRGLKSARHIISISEATKKELIEYLGFPDSQITVIPFAIDELYLQRANDLPENIQTQLPKNFILHVGSSVPRKGLERLFQVMALDSEIPNLVQVGGEKTKSIQDALLGLNLENRVLFLGGQKDEVIHRLYQDCSAFIFPSLYEGFGVPPLEAFAAGAKIITTEMPSVNEVLRLDPVLNLRGSLEEWAKKIAAVVNESSNSHEDIRKSKHEWTWESRAKTYIEIYKEFLS